MTVATSATAGQEATSGLQPVNPFETSLNLGFHLNGEVPQIAEEMRQANPPDRHRITIPPRRLTPDTKDKTPEEKKDIRDAVDKHNEARRRLIEDYFATYLSRTTAELLSRKTQRLVTGFVILRCPKDSRYTLLVEHDAFG